MRWIRLRSAPRDVEFMIRSTCVDEIAGIDFHSYITVRPPLLSKYIRRKMCIIRT